MKKITILIFLLFVIYNSNAQGVWTWMSGDTNPNSNGIYGTQGIPSINNHPPSIYTPFCWTDLQGNFWMYGGADVHNFLNNNLWKFNPTTLEWTWMNGAGLKPKLPHYGTIGIASSSNTPGGRHYSGCTWMDKNGDLWLYGGNGSRIYSDLWKYNIASNEWTWMSGDSLINQSPVYGTKGISSLSNSPGGRYEMGTPWVDISGNFWMYGGYDGSLITYADMWKYSPLINEWTWMSGDSLINQSPVYGTKGISSLSNSPGSRWPYAMITESNGNFLLFGGANNTKEYSDLWEYNPIINQWTWLNGSQNINAKGISGTTCQTDSSFYPDARFENRAAWKDCTGNLWIYGGFNDSTATAFGDVWVYIVSLKKWARMSDSTYSNTKSTYGTIGITSLSNQPGSRFGSANWKDKNGNFWMYGGFNSNIQSCGDLWEYIPDSNCVNSKCNCIINSGNITLSHDTICENSGQITTLTLNNSIGNLQWQSSIDGIHFSNLFGDTLPIYTTSPTLSQTTYYRTIISTNCGKIDSSSSVIIHIIPSPIASFNYIINNNQVTFNSDSSSKDVTSFNWNFGDNKLSINSNPIHIFDTVKQYMVCLTAYNGSNCSYTLCKNVDLTSNTTTNINNIPEPLSIQIYPNPANNILNISSNNIEGNYQLKIYNSIGQELIQKELNIKIKEAIIIPLNTLSNGVYELILTDKNKFYNTKFIKQLTAL